MKYRVYNKITNDYLSKEDLATSYVGLEVDGKLSCYNENAFFTSFNSFKPYLEVEDCTEIITTDNKLIYEKDIVRIKIKEVKEVLEMEVEWCKKGYYNIALVGQIESIYIIGNVHEQE